MFTVASGSEVRAVDEGSAEDSGWSFKSNLQLSADSRPQSRMESDDFISFAFQIASGMVSEISCHLDFVNKK